MNCLRLTVLKFLHCKSRTEASQKAAVKNFFEKNPQNAGF